MTSRTRQAATAAAIATAVTTALCTFTGCAAWAAGRWIRQLTILSLFSVIALVVATAAATTAIRYHRHDR